MILKLQLEVEAINDMNDYGYKKGERVILYNNIFNTLSGLCYEPLDKNWKVVNCNILEFKNDETTT